MIRSEGWRSRLMSDGVLCSVGAGKPAWQGSNAASGTRTGSSRARACGPSSLTILPRSRENVLRSSSLNGDISVSYALCTITPERATAFLPDRLSTSCLQQRSLVPVFRFTQPRSSSALTNCDTVTLFMPTARATSPWLAPGRSFMAMRTAYWAGERASFTQHSSKIATEIWWARRSMKPGRAYSCERFSTGTEGMDSG